ncbi:peptidoglycan-binding domain-containing protein [Desulfosporosinus nitroreducens]|uniref:peptidoglycan-binding domain-containing protein n=1 Tax=Desulfosporosinus nitroreducens TaxID=2018668 RepID=UPI00207CF58B|nr:peptidoglycan-binding domain-containing protein [Desulfosporosinus nitroreducens]MCO1604309.1 peptidoglycan-binding protein [Desulfosporosinus nitroreducens]
MRILRIGSTGEDVIQLQSTLSILNYNPGITDGIFGVKTASAVIQFQKDYGLVPDGIVGPIT